MAISVGDKIPDVEVALAANEGPQKTTTMEALGKGKVVVFAVPGAYTPTCSARHLPGFVDKFDELKAEGVDKVACLAVNDAFVMQAWGEDHHASAKIDMIADGNGDFTRALGLTLDASAFGMGERSQRFAMILQDGVVKDLFIEAPGAFEVSSAEYVLKNL